MPDYTFSPRDVGTTRRILPWQHPSRHHSLHMFRPHGDRHILHDLLRGRSICGIKIRQVDAAESEGARLRICKRCFKSTGFAVLGWVVTVTVTHQERMEFE